MNFALTPEQESIREAIFKVCARFEAEPLTEKP